MLLSVCLRYTSYSLYLLYIYFFKEYTMKRRLFVKASLLTGSVSGIMPIVGMASANTDTQKPAAQEFYELRVYTLKNEAQQKLVSDYFQHAAIPVFNRLGSKNVGVFTELKPAAYTKLYVIIPFASLEQVLKINESMTGDAAYNKAGAAYLQAPSAEPAYERIESSLLRAFTHMPKMEVPEKKSRLFELRRYESAGERAGKKKIDMFNSEGEIDIFKTVGFRPVFFGETLFGPMRPNLTYMVTFDDMEDHGRKWKSFGSNPDWKRISAIPEYADAKIVSAITSTFLVPAAYSQI